MTKIDKVTFHQEHHARNLGLISEEEQKKIDNTRVLIAGCGVGSQIALSAARMGFEKFLLIDGDKVELSNINRQGFSWRDRGHYKVDALSRKIKAINPHASVKKYPVFLDEQNVKKIVNKSDLIIDAIDPVSGKAIIALHREAARKDKPIIVPLDIGWGAGVIVFNSTSTSYENLIGINKNTPISKLNDSLLLGKFVDFFKQIAPSYVREILADAMSGKLSHYPQPITAVNILSGIVITIAMKVVLGREVKTAPDIIYFDPSVY